LGEAALRRSIRTGEKEMFYGASVLANVIHSVKKIKLVDFYGIVGRVLMAN
jgi:hypothetical protein